MTEDFDSEMQKIVEESRKLLTRPWTDVQAEIKKRQMLGKLPPQINISPPQTDNVLEKFVKLPPAKPQI